MKKQTFLLASSTLALLCACGGPSKAQDAPAAPAVENLVPNGDFQTDEDKDGTPDKWGKAKGNFSYEKEGENTFMRLTATEPDKLVLFYRAIAIPEGVKALELTWKQRVSDLKVGDQAWFDARIMMNWKDAAGEKMKGGPSAPYTRKNTEGWVESSKSFLVPDGAKTLEWMPSLFRVKAGTFDLDNIVLKATDPAPLEAAAR